MRSICMFLLVAGVRVASAQTFAAGDSCWSGGTVWGPTQQANLAKLPATLQTLEYGLGGKQITCIIPVPSPGKYAVSVISMEPNKTGTGQRVFTITVNGQQSSPIDLWSLVGQQAPYEYDTPYFYAQSYIVVSAKPTAVNFNPVVTSITVAPQAQVSTAGADPLFPIPQVIAPPGPANVWVTDSLVKVPGLQTLPGGSPGPQRSLVIKAAKNEITSFQVHAGGPIGALSVSVSDFVGTGGTISASSTDVVVFREDDMNVTIPTAVGPTYLGFIGPIPDILVPVVDPYYNQTSTAFPVAVAAGANRSAWVDVHVPPTLPTGWYRSTAVVKDGATTLASIPILLGVWDWTLPSTSTLASTTNMTYDGFCVQAYGPGAGCAAYPGSLNLSDFGATLADRDAAIVLLDNHYSLSFFSNMFPGAGPFSNVPGQAFGFDDIYGPLLSGTAPTILKGAHVTSWQITRIPSLQPAPATYQNFVDHFKANGWPMLFNGLKDEPGVDPTAWNDIVTNGAAEHGYSTPIVPNLVTTDLVTAQKFNADSLIDILVTEVNVLEPGGGSPPEDTSAIKAWVAASPTTRKWWTYQACPSSGTCTNGVTGPQFSFQPTSFPNYDVDGTPVANRAMEWNTYRLGASGELYYYVDVCSTGGVSANCGNPPGGAGKQNPLVTNYYSGGWGDGTLIYPGPTAYTGTKTPIWLPSIRLKHIRDGMQDYEYLHALEAAGQGALSASTTATLVTNGYTLASDPDILRKAREVLGSALHKLGLSGAVK